MINGVVTYINSKLTDLAENYGLCEQVVVVDGDNEQSHIKQLGENGNVIDFDKVHSLSYLLPNGEFENEELIDENDVGCSIVQRFNYPVKLVVYKDRCDLTDLDEIYNIIQQVATNNDPDLVSKSKAYQGAKIISLGGTHNKIDIWNADFENKPFRIGLYKILISINLNIQLDLDLSCDIITAC